MPRGRKLTYTDRLCSATSDDQRCSSQSQFAYMADLFLNQFGSLAAVQTTNFTIAGDFGISIMVITMVSHNACIPVYTIESISR